MASEDHQIAIVTIFDLEEVHLDRGTVLFRQRIPSDGERFHYWSMDLVDYEAPGRPPSFQMALTAYDSPAPMVETVVKEVVAAEAIKEMVVEAVTEAVEQMEV